MKRVERKSKLCLTCRTEFKQTDGDVKRGPKRWESKKTCSKECKRIALIGLKHNYPIRKSIEQRFWEQVVVNKTGCWGWKGSKDLATSEWN